MRLRVLVAIGCSLALVAPITTAQASDGGTSLSQAQEQSSITQARAKKLAKAGVLKKSDLPGFTAERITAEPEDAADERAFLKCFGVKAPKYAARNLGVAFTNDALEIQSAVDVLKTVAMAKADMKLARSKKAPGCIKKQLIRVLEREGAEIASLSVKRVDVKVKGADVSAAFRYTSVVTFEGLQFRLTGHSVTALVGQTEIYVSPGLFADPAYAGPKPSLKQSIALARIAAKRVAAA